MFDSAFHWKLCMKQNSLRLLLTTVTGFDQFVFFSASQNVALWKIILCEEFPVSFLSVFPSSATKRGDCWFQAFTYWGDDSEKFGISSFVNAE